MNTLCKVFLIVSLAQSAWAQDFTFSPNPRQKTGFSRESYRFPDGIMVYDMDKQKTYLAIDRLTLIRIWSKGAGSEPPDWQRARDLSSRFKDRGLEFISVNFENGSDFKTQHRMLQAFFSERPQPEKFYFDALGYTVDLLRIPGFPIYYLVDKDGMVVFRTYDGDEEGMAILHSEIDFRLD